MTVSDAHHGPVAGPVADVPAADAPAPASELRWRRVHPVTPAIKGWKVLVVVIAIVGQQVSQNVTEARDVVDSFGWVWVLAAMGAVVLVGFLYSLVAWRMTRYAVDAEAVYLQTGVLFRQQRSARLDRVQAIDVVQPLLARVVGLAELRIEVAGGSDSAVRLSFLKDDDAQRVRDELLARAAGLDVGEGEDAAPPPAAPEREVLSVPPGRLIESVLRTSMPFWVLLVVGAAVVGVVATGELGPLFGLLPALFGIVGYVWQRFVGEFGFRAALSPDGIRMRRGLLETQAQTLPPGRVQAVRLSQPLLWRTKDWWRVQVNLAGYQVTGDQAKQSLTVLLPVGDRQEALTALWLVLPDLGTPDPRALLDAALSGSDDAQGFVTSPRRARWLDPLAWRRNGFVVTDRALLARGGRLVRRLVVVPHERTQSLGLTQGPLQRRLGLATFTLHSVPGPVVPHVPHLDVDVAGRLMAEQADRARTARRAAGPERWMAALAAQADEAPAQAFEDVPAQRVEDAPAGQVEEPPAWPTDEGRAGS